MREIIKYVADDGSEWDLPQQAILRDAQCGRKKQMAEAQAKAEAEQRRIEAEARERADNLIRGYAT